MVQGKKKHDLVPPCIGLIVALTFIFSVRAIGNVVQNTYLYKEYIMPRMYVAFIIHAHLDLHICNSNEPSLNDFIDCVVGECLSRVP